MSSKPRPDAGQRKDPGEAARGLVAAGPSKVGVVKAMRARDVSREPSGDPQGARSGQEGAGASGSGGSSPEDS